MLLIVPKFSLIVRCDTKRVNSPAVPALSFVPLALDPPNGCCPGMAPVHWSLSRVSQTHVPTDERKPYWQVLLDVKVASGESKFLRRLDYSRAVLGKECTTQGVLRGFVH